MNEFEQVTIALNPRIMGPLLEDSFGPEIDRPDHRGSRQPEIICQIKDMKYEPGEYCLILYQLADQFVIGSFDWSGEEGGANQARRLVHPPDMNAFLFPHDPALPGLTRALDPQSVSEALAQALPELHPSLASILRCQVTVLRFRPGKRCTVRLDLSIRAKETGQISKRRLYAKIYHQLEKANHAFREMQMLSKSAPAREGRIIFADAPAMLPELAMVLQEPVQGIPMDLYLTCNTPACHPHTAAGIMQASAALAALHTCGLAAGRERPIGAELVRFGKRAAKIGRVNPSLGEAITRLASSLSGWLGRLEDWGAEITLVHGDCKPSQFLICPDGKVALLDFDHCGMADPAGDVGTFMATLQQLKVQHAVKQRGQMPPCSSWIPELKQQFLENYRLNASFSDHFYYRAAWYEAVALLRKAIRSFERSPYSRMPEVLISEAWQVLATLP